MRIPLLSKKYRRLYRVMLVIVFLYFDTQQITGTAIHPEHLLKTPSYYQVTQVYDGDTIEVDMLGVKEKVRMIGVNTPETHDPRKPIECFGPQASDFTHIQLAGKRVRLQADPLDGNRDRYDRLLRYIYLEDGTLYNAKLIEEGYGFALTAFPFTKSREFKQIESLAKNNNKGLWATCQ